MNAANPPEPAESPDDLTVGQWLSQLSEALDHAENRRMSHLDDGFAEKGLAFLNETADFEKIALEAIAPEKEDYDRALARLGRLSLLLGWSKASFEFVGCMWGSWLQQNAQNTSADLLTAFPAPRQPEFFTLLQSLPEVIRRIPLPLHKAEPWFRLLRKRMGNDMAVGGYWRGLQIWCRINPDDAIAALQEVSNSALDEDITWRAYILSALRDSPEIREKPFLLSAICQDWKQSASSNARLAYLRSWGFAVGQRDLSSEEINNYFEFIEVSNTQELNESASFVYEVISRGRLPLNLIDRVVGWIESFSGPTCDPIYKHRVCASAWAVVGNTENSNAWTEVSKKRLLMCLIAIQPVEAAHHGTWREIDRVLATLLKEDREDVASLLQKLFDSNKSALTSILKDHDGGGELRDALAQWEKLPELIAELFAPAMNRRRFALCLINSGLSARLPRELDEVPDERLALGILQLRFDHLAQDQVAPLFLHLARIIDRRSDDLKRLFFADLVFQAKNLPGACLDAFKNASTPTPLLTDAIKEAESYLTALRDVSQSPVIAIEVPGLNRARRASMMQQSRLINEGAKRASPLLRMIKSTTLIYGSEGFSHYAGGHIGPATPFSEISTQFEVPRLALLDYEGNAIRRHLAFHEMKEIESSLT